jgi:hypothetical protein
VGGPVVDAACLESAGGPDPKYQPIDAGTVARDTSGADVIVAIHGFNVSRPKAVRSYVTLEAELQLAASQQFFGVLWPGDFWLPVVNYPAEASDAVEAGRRLAAYLDAHMAQAASISFISHSLGGRVLLEAVQRLGRPVNQLCITAGALDNNCLSKQYLAAKRKAERVSVLSSRADTVLKLAYPLGDFGSDVLFGDRDSPWRGALGLKGPNPFEPAPKVRHRPIDKGLDYGHGDYFPPSDGGPGDGDWRTSVAYMRRCVNGLPDSW